MMVDLEGSRRASRGTCSSQPAPPRTSLARATRTSSLHIPVKGERLGRAGRHVRPPRSFASSLVITVTILSVTNSRRCHCHCRPVRVFAGTADTRLAGAATCSTLLFDGVALPYARWPCAPVTSLLLIRSPTLMSFNRFSLLIKSYFLYHYQHWF